MVKKPRIALIVQARLGSKRLPGKILKEVMGKPVLELLLERLQRVQGADDLIVATTDLSRDQPIIDLCEKMGISPFRGAEEDVLARYLDAAREVQAEVIVRVTADCPLIDPELIDEHITFFLKSYPQYDYVSNAVMRTYPRGLDVEVCTVDALKIAATSSSAADHEHVTLYIRNHPEQFSICNLAQEPDASHHRWTLDTAEDLQLIRQIYEALYPKNPKFSRDDVLQLLEEHPDWKEINAHIPQKEASS